MIEDPTDPYGGYPPPPGEPGDPMQPNGWWTIINGVWTWMTKPAPYTVSASTQD